MKISVIGSGSWGTALAILLSDNKHDVCLWSAFESEISNMRESGENPLLKGVKLSKEIALTCELDKALSGADVLLLAVPSHVIKSVCNKIKETSKCPELVISVAKGFDEDTGERLSEVIKNELGIKFPVVLSGPTHAEEVARKIPTAIVAACEDAELAKKVQDIFMSPVFRVYTNTDVTGVELSGALKNVIALCAGISDGIGFGDNTKAALMTRGMAEIMRLGMKMGGKPETFSGLTGIGDLIVTCTSMHSRNRRAGILIGQGKTPEEATKEVGMVVEGIKTCKTAFKIANKLDVEMPIVKTAHDVLFNGKNAKQAVSELMGRDKKEE